MHSSFSHQRIEKVVSNRRTKFFATFIIFYTVLVWSKADILWHLQMKPLEWIQLGLFAVLIFPLCIGFLTSLFGFILEIRGGDCFTITRLGNLPQVLNPEYLQSKTAIIMPVFNEDASMVFERIRVIYLSLERKGFLKNFDFFVLSDSNDPKCWLTEEIAWMELCRQLQAFGKIFYRKRRLPINKKSGNVADFCRRWGKRYDFMITLDADSLLEADAIVKLTVLMEKNPQVGIIQTAPTLVRGQSLFSRISQFVVSFYGRIFCSGLNYWQMANGMYWGHNAILRLAPFINHCHLPNLPGSVPFGGRILSHDFVEAALMQRAGYQVWLAYDIPGSYEEGPPTWIDFIKRDRRWCAGNLQHFWLLLSRELNSINRLHLLLGVLSYLTSPLWLCYIVVSFLQYLENLRGGNVATQSLIYRTFGQIGQELAPVVLFVVVISLLIIPRFLAWLANGLRFGWRIFGGSVRSLISVFLELLLSSLAAPVHMVMNSKFVVFTALGKSVSWLSQKRHCGQGSTWREAWDFHRSQFFLGFLILMMLYYHSGEFLPILVPMVLGLLLSVPLSVFSSRREVGDLFRKLGLFLTPEETRPSNLLLQFEKNVHMLESRKSNHDGSDNLDQITNAFIDPYLNAVHVVLLRRRGQRPQKINEHIQQLCQKLIVNGVESLQGRELTAVLQDAQAMEWLHHKIWSCPADQLHPSLRKALQKYNLLDPQPQSPLCR